MTNSQPHRNSVRVQAAIANAGLDAQVRVLEDSARTVAGAAGSHHAVFPSAYENLLLLTSDTPSDVGTPATGTEQ